MNGMALDLEIAQRVFAAIEDGDEARDLLGELPEFSVDLVETAKRSGGAIFPDGFAVLGRDEDLSHYSQISIKPPAQAAHASVEDERASEAVVTEEIGGTETRLRSDSKVDVLEDDHLLYLTHE
jgi:hypothetical protein